MIVLSGASASGKTEVAKELEATYKITKVITTTTRKMREHEVDGVDYFFVSNEKFLEMINQDEFVEYTQYNGNFYGSTKNQVKDNKCVVIDPAGLKAYSQLQNNNVVTFLLECDEYTRYNRMIGRGDSTEDASRRILNDKFAFSNSNICEVDCKINTKNINVKEVARKIYDFYMKSLQSKK